MDLYVVYLKLIVLLSLLSIVGCNDIARSLSREEAQVFADNVVCAFSQEQRRNGACWCFVRDDWHGGVSMTLAPKEFCKYIP